MNIIKHETKFAIPPSLADTESDNDGCDFDNSALLIHENNIPDFLPQNQIKKSNMLLMFFKDVLNMIINMYRYFM